MSIIKLIAGGFVFVLGLSLGFQWDIGLDFAQTLGLMGAGLAVEVAPVPLP